MLNYTGILISLLSTIFFSIDPWKKRKVFNKYNIKLGWIGMFFLVLGAGVSLKTTYNSNNEATELKRIAQNIDTTTSMINENSYKFYDSIISDHRSKYITMLDSLGIYSGLILKTVIENSDSSLRDKIEKTRIQYKSMEEDYVLLKDFSDSYYTIGNWPVSVKADSINEIIMDVFDVYIYMTLNGSEKFYVYYLILNNGQISEPELSTIDSLYVKLKPIDFNFLTSSNVILRLYGLGMIREEYLDDGTKNIIFNEPYLSRAIEYCKLKSIKKLRKKLGIKDGLRLVSL